MAVAPRNIVILCDGTGKNGKIDSAKGEPVTNVWELYKLLYNRNIADFVKYFPGVGADNKKATVSDVLARTFGHTVVESIREIYKTIVDQYRDGDTISLFGYSRGAFIVRKVASLINHLGLIDDEANFNEYWKSLENKLPGRRSKRPDNRRSIPISCLGVWDTVGAVRPRAIRETLNLLSLPDDELPANVDSALHILAYHENRKLFNAVLFKNAFGSRRCKQVVFPGSHSGVGGGGKEVELPKVTLDWMARNIPEAIRVQLTQSRDSNIPQARDLYSVFHDSPSWKRIPDKLFQRDYLNKTPGLLRHRTLLALASPDSPHLLPHAWQPVEATDATEEEIYAMPPAKPTVVRRMMHKVQATTRLAFQRNSYSSEPPTPTLATLPIRPQTRPVAPIPHIRLDSTSTQQTDTTTESNDTASTGRTSVMSGEFASDAIPEECADDEYEDMSEPAVLPKPESEPLPVETPQPQAKIEPQARIEPTTAEVEPITEPITKPVVEPITEKIATQSVEKPTPAALPNRAQAPKPKKGIVRRIKGFFRKTLCAGR